MPQTNTDLGIELLHPENWTPAPREDATSGGVTFDLPGGGFFSIDPTDGDDEEAIDRLFETTQSVIEADYGSVEREPLAAETARGMYRGEDFQFYFLDLIITSRLMILLGNDRDYAVQIQAEQRDFEKNEEVFQAILAQLLPPNA